MAHSDSEGETIDDLEFETRTTDADGEEDNEIDEDLLGALENGVEDASEVEEVGQICLSIRYCHLVPLGIPHGGFRR